MDAAAPAASGAPKFSDAAFDLSLESPTGPVKSGQVSTAEVVLVAKPPFHVNDKYPIKLKLRETAGVKYESLVLGRDAVKLETSKAVMPVAFRAEGSGKRTVAGQFSFSVCTEDKCMIEKRDLSLDINVD